MKKFFTLIALFAISTCAVMAQNQILNGGFEDWGEIIVLLSKLVKFLVLLLMVQ